MNRNTTLGASVALALIAAGVIASAQQQTPFRLPSSPPQLSGASVTPAFEGWWDNPDGTHSFLIGYFSRNTEASVDVPIGPNNKFQPGNADMGQPTHFLPRRHFGMFVVNVPKEFPRTQSISWTLTVAGNTATIPFHMHTDYRISAFKSTEEAQNRDFNRPPTLRFVEGGPAIVGPIGTPMKAIERKAAVGTPMPLDIWAEDDAIYSVGTSAPLSGDRPPVTLSVTKFRGPGTVKVSEGTKFSTTKGGKANEPWAGKSSTTVTFSEAGEYMLHVQLNDFSGPGGGGSGCCWTTGIVKVLVSGPGSTSGR